MSSSQKKLDEKHSKILRELVNNDTNRYCFDCNQRGPTYVNVTIGSFVCTTCAGLLRKFNHRMKSMSMCNFSVTEMEFLKKRGNDMCRKIYFGLCDRTALPSADLLNVKSEELLRMKYDVKKWYMAPSTELEEAVIRMNQEIFDRVEKTGGRMPRNAAVKAPPGILSQPPKSSITSSVSVDTFAGINGDSSKAVTQTVNSVASTGPPKSITMQDLLGDLDGDLFSAPASTAQPVASAAWPPTNTTDDTFGTFQAVKTQASVPVTLTTSVAASIPPPSMGDRYAALAELDGLFSSTSVSGAAPVTSTGGGWSVPGSGSNVRAHQNATTAKGNIPWGNQFAGNRPPPPTTGGQANAVQFGWNAASSNFPAPASTSNVQWNMPAQANATAGWSQFGHQPANSGTGPPFQSQGGMQASVANPFMNIPSQQQQYSSSTNPFY